jgi:hypothetical protein
LDIDEDNVDITPLMRMSVWGQGNYTRNIPLIPDGEAALAVLQRFFPDVCDTILPSR